MCSPTQLETYAEQICSAAKQISAWCALNNHPHPSFDRQAPTITLPTSAPQKILTARQTLIESAFKIQQLATEPNEYLPRLAVHVSWGLHVID
jgi:6-hydroxytryprostatin B O-methyltransferase